MVPCKTYDGKKAPIDRCMYLILNRREENASTTSTGSHLLAWQICRDSLRGDVLDEYNPTAWPVVCVYKQIHALIIENAASLIHDMSFFFVNRCALRRLNIPRAKAAPHGYQKALSVFITL